MKGFTLVETLIVLAFVLAMVAGTYALSRGPATVADASLALPRLVESARELAATSGDGATIVLTPSTNTTAAGSFAVAIYQGRPDGGGSFNTVPRRTSRMPGTLTASAVGSGPVAIFLSTAGTMSYASWSPSAPPLAAEPACTQPLTLGVAPGRDVAATSFQLSCTDARAVRL